MLFFYSKLSLNLPGYLKHHSYCTALLKITEDWRRSLDNREAVIAVAVDLSKVFDSINYSLQLVKLKAYGFSSSAFNLMFSYLLGRNGVLRCKASDRDIEVGVQQGSLLEP